MNDLKQYGNLLNEIKDRIRQAQVKAVLSVNAEMIRMYWDIGRMIDQRQKSEGWGAGVIPKLAKDIQNDLSEVKGFSERNIKLMTQFYREYPIFITIGQQSVAQLGTAVFEVEKVPQPVAQLDIVISKSEKGQQLIAQLGWAHNVLLMQKIKSLPNMPYEIFINQSAFQNTNSHASCRIILNQACPR